MKWRDTSVIPNRAVMALREKEQPLMPPPKVRRGKSLVRKRTIYLDKHKTSVSVEDAFWAALKEIAAAQGISIGRLIAAIKSKRRERQGPNFSSAIRLFVLDYYRRRPVR